MKSKLKNALVILAIAAATPVFAQSVSYGALVAQKDTPQAQAYMSGVMDGVMGLTAINSNKGIKGTFCPPVGTKINGKDLTAMTHDYAKVFPEEERNSKPLFMLATLALADKYPCK